jgi:hypothetical protein
MPRCCPIFRKCFARGLFVEIVCKKDQNAKFSALSLGLSFARACGGRGGGPPRPHPRRPARAELPRARAHAHGGEDEEVMELPRAASLWWSSAMGPWRSTGHPGRLASVESWNHARLHALRCGRAHPCAASASHSASIGYLLRLCFLVPVALANTFVRGGRSSRDSSRR